MPRTLLVDTNRAAYPIYHALQAQGHDVWVVGDKPSEVLAKLSPNHIQLDYSNAAQLAALVDEHRFDYLVPGCTDVSYSVCSQINEGRYPGFDSPETTYRINDKTAFRQTAARLCLSAPRVLDTAEAADAPAIIIKPADAFSGRGIKVLKEPSPAAIQTALSEARAMSSTSRALIEEYVSGQLYSHSAFLKAGKIVADFFVREDCSATPFAVDTSYITNEISTTMRCELRAQIELFARELALVDGLVHTQFISHSERFWIIEMTRRCPGDIYSLLIEFSTGYPYAASYAAPFVGETAMPAFPASGHNEYIIRHTVTARDGTNLWGLRFHQPMNIRLWVPLATAGDSLTPSPAGRAAIFFLHSASEAEHHALYASLLAGTLYSFD